MTSLRIKSVLLYASTTVILFILLYGISQYVILESFRKLEEDAVGYNMIRLLRAVDSELSNLESQTRDWAFWDETYDFVKGDNPGYLEDNFDSSSVSNLRLNVILLMNESGDIVYAEGFNLQEGVKEPVPPSLLEAIKDERLLRPNGINSSASGLLLLSEKPILLDSQPITTSRYEGPIAGTLVFGRYFDSYEVQLLEALTQVPAELYRMDGVVIEPITGGDLVSESAGASKPDDYITGAMIMTGYGMNPYSQGKIQEDAGDAIEVKEIDEYNISGTATLKDLSGRPALLIKSVMPRSIYEQGKKSIDYLLILFLLAALAFGAMDYFTLDRLVLSRLLRLSREIGGISSRKDFSARVNVVGGDELSSLEADVNDMLGSLEESSKKEVNLSSELRERLSEKEKLSAELTKRLEEVQQWCQVTQEREVRMGELKRRIRDLEESQR